MSDFFSSFFYEYNIATEIAMILVDVVFLGIFVFSKPERTKMFRVLRTGLTAALLIMLLHIIILAETILMRKTNNGFKINVFYTLYSICYVVELECILYYQIHLSFKQRFRKKTNLTIGIIMGLIWTSLLFFPMLQDTLVIFDNGKYLLTSYSDAYVLCSFVCGIAILFLTIANRKDVSKIVLLGTSVFNPIIIAVTIAQFHFHNAYFICATYTLPFIIYYCLFHSNKYNGVSGCQGYDAYKTYLNSCIKNKNRFMQMYITAPKLRGRDLSDISDIIAFTINNYCREIEKIKSRIRIYNISQDEYVIISLIKKNTDIELIKNKIIMIVSNRIQINDKSYKLLLNFIISRDSELIKNVNEYLAIVNYKKKCFQNLNRNQLLYVTEEDINKYKRYTLIEKNLLDIKHNNNLNDKRILLYVQPIYDIHKGEFRTGESLMRLEIDGTMIFPDEFIPIAESIDCIHALTRIILYKVAKLTARMKETYDFDALTVNVSTIEMTSPFISEEFMGIIKRAKAEPENIRMEITESTNISDYQMVISNIKNLKEMGITFYLDDFGTGYSNIDRVLSIPFRTIKFDKSLMYKAIEDKETEELFMFLARYFKNHGLSLVTEGVEDEKQVEYVKAAGFDYIQGYFYSKPLPETDALKFFKLKSES